jgi:ABC-2 type transport system permease protein
MRALTGTWRLVRLALRRDRTKLPIWIAAIIGLASVGPPALSEFYGTAEKQLEYAATTAPSVVSRMLAGPVDGPSLGSIMMIEYFLFFAVLVAFMSTLAVVRHTRQNEETGRSEIIGSAIVGRHSALTAALVVAIGANVLVALLMGLTLVSNNLPVEGSWAMALGVGAVGIVFAGIAAIAAQIFESARAANSLAAAIIGVAFLVRGIGDVMGTVAENGLSVASAWPVWLSPLGWGQQMHPFADTIWWPLALSGVVLVGLVTAAFYLTSHRDVGLGILPARRGPVNAAKALLSPLGLAWRLQKGILIGWSVGIAAMGVTLGITAIEFKDFFTENEDFAEVIASYSGGAQGDITDVYFAGMLAFMGILISGYALQAILRVRSEEASGQLEPVLSGAVSRPGWMFSHIGCVLGGILAITLVAGLSTGLSYALMAGAELSDGIRIALAAFAQAPAVLVLVGLAILLFGVLPRAAIAVTWSAFAACLLVLQLGAILNLPQWTQNLSPFTHLPGVPAEAISWTPIVVLLSVALALAAVGFALFRRRDLTTQ